MIAFDTNVLVRVIVGDDPEQASKAERAFMRHAKGDGIFVSMIVICELAWVLSRGYHLDRKTVHGRIDRLVRTRGVFIEDVGLVSEALDRYKEGAAELPDYLLLGRAGRSGAEELLTFDRRLAREPDVRLLR